MKFAVVNDIHVGKCLEYDEKVRASSHLIEEISFSLKIEFYSLLLLLL